jgi:hypothetical protein
MRSRLLVLTGIALLFSAFPLSGATQYPCADNTTTCDPYASDQETSNGTSTGGSWRWYGSPYYYCGANARWGQKCWDAVLNPETKVLECRQVNSSARCACHMDTKETVGMCEQRYP